jgi:peptidoglycan/xylan/chitin deacetylase (PgdA/CDA1 family)
MKTRFPFILAAFLTALLLAPPCPGAPQAVSVPQNSAYNDQKASIIVSYGNKTPLSWGETVSGVKTRIKSGEKTIALTLDACGSPKGMKFDKALIDYLEQERIPATLFVNGRWIEPNRKEFDRLAANPLFEIGNHGLAHKPASVNGRSAYGIQGTKNIAELVDEIELNAEKIEALTGRRTKFYRSGTAYYDEIAVRIAGELGHQVAGFSLLGDAGATFSRKQVRDALLSAKAGDIVILHFNHPESGTAGGVMDAVPELKRRGFRFVRLSDVELE